MRRFWWTGFLAMLITGSILLAGCSGQKAATPAGTDAAKAPKERPMVKLAFLGPLSGSNSRMGFGGQNSAQLRINQANENNSLKYKYELLSLDDECKAQSGVQAALKASSDTGIIGAIAHYCSVVALSTVDTYHRQGLAAIVWGAVHPDITYGNDFKEVFRVNGTQIQQNDTAADFAVKQLGYKKFAVMHDTTDYGRGHFKYFKAAVEKLGGEIVSVHAVGPEQQDFTAELTQIKAKNPEVIWFAGLTPIGVRIRTQMEKLGIKVQFQGTSGIMNQEYNDAVGAKTAEGTFAFIDGKPVEELPGGKDFMDAYQKAGFKDPYEAYGPFAYVAADLFIKAVEAVGPDRAKVIDYLDTKINNVDTIIGKVNFNEKGQNDVPLVTPEVSQDGKWVPYQKSEYATGKRKFVGK